MDAWFPPDPILPGSEQERFARETARFLGVTFDLDELNRRLRMASFKRWHRRQEQARDEATRLERARRRQEHRTAAQPQRD